MLERTESPVDTKIENESRRDEMLKEPARRQDVLEHGGGHLDPQHLASAFRQQMSAERLQDLHGRAVFVKVKIRSHDPQHGKAPDEISLQERSDSLFDHEGSRYLFRMIVIAGKKDEYRHDEPEKGDQRIKDLPGQLQGMKLDHDQDGQTFDDIL